MNNPVIVRRLAQETGVSASTAWKICRDDLLFPYKMQLSQSP
jgi:predicted DNA-binding transcriptional regulator AlpA